TPGPSGGVMFKERIALDFPGYKSRIAPTMDAAATFIKDDLTYNLYVYLIDGSFPGRLARVLLDDVVSVAWSVDGRQVAYIGRTGSTYKLYVTNVFGLSRVLRTSTDLAKGSLAWTYDSSNIWVDGPQVNVGVDNSNNPVSNDSLIRLDASNGTVLETVGFPYSTIYHATWKGICSGVNRFTGHPYGGATIGGNALPANGPLALFFELSNGSFTFTDTFTSFAFAQKASPNGENLWVYATSNTSSGIRNFGSVLTSPSLGVGVNYTDFLEIIPQ
ncbi:MAG: hypothetical protein ABUL49_02170, partial [bacterium]